MRFSILSRLLFILCAVGLSVGVSAQDIQKWELSSIYKEFPLRLIRKHRDWIWNTPHSVYWSKDLYFKIWGDAQRSKNFIEVYNSGAFDTIAPLVALIYNQGTCCGYVTFTCNPLTKEDYIPLLERPITFDASQMQPPILQKLLTELKRITITTGYFFGDIAAVNLGMYEGKCFLIDLDSVVSLSAINGRILKKAFSRKKTVFKDADEVTQATLEWKANRKISIETSDHANTPERNSP